LVRLSREEQNYYNPTDNVLLIPPKCMLSTLLGPYLLIQLLMHPMAFTPWPPRNL